MSSEEKEERRITRRGFVKGVAALGAAGVLASCGTTPAPQIVKETVEVPVEVTRIAEVAAVKEGGSVPVAIQVSSIDNKEQLVKRATELINRGMVSSVKAPADLADVGCDYLKELASQGFDIQVPIAANEEGATYEQELATTRERKEALEACLGTTVRSYGAVSRFSIDEHSPQILDELGAKYIWVSARYEKMPCYTLRPYKEPGHNFARVLMQSRCLYKPMGVGPLDQQLLAMTGST